MAELQTPWLRQELLAHLRRLSDQRWLVAALDESGRPGDGLDDLFDFFDDTGVVDGPGGRVGYVLRDAREAAVLAMLGVKLNEALDAASREAGKRGRRSANGLVRVDVDPPCLGPKR